LGRVLRRRQGYQLRAGALSLLLPARKGIAGRLLEEVRQGPEDGPDGLQVPRRRARRGGHEEVPGDVGELGPAALLSVTVLFGAEWRRAQPHPAEEPLCASLRVLGLSAQKQVVVIW